MKHGQNFNPSVTDKYAWPGKAFGAFTMGTWGDTTAHDLVDINLLVTVLLATRAECSLVPPSAKMRSRNGEWKRLLGLGEKTC